MVTFQHSWIILCIVFSSKLSCIICYYCSTVVFIQFFCSLFIIHKKIFSSNPGLDSRYFDPVVQEPSSSMQVNKHHISDCTIFVLVYAWAAYYNHRHRGIYKTNILQAVQQAEGETSLLTNQNMFCFHFSVCIPCFPYCSNDWPVWFTVEARVAQGVLGGG